ncbi:DNA repair protein RecO [Legionella fairfieldensis]|uniref:DNA repair protein RecO n=1 Tax=Legionella fairfieldensis TaxID=45064 RepID=UPI000491C8F2|nr:DNA repair protein RecO [Legionella fairfieldensis]
MTTETFEAWLLHKRPSGDTSAQATFFTREKGILNCLYKGGRTPKKQATLQPFIPLWLAIDARKDWIYVRHLETIAHLCSPRGHSLWAGLYMNELLFYALRPMDPQPALFDVYLGTMQQFVTNPDKIAVEVLLRRFEWGLLLACGYSVSFNEEARTFTPIVIESFYQFIAGEGFIAAERGFTGKDILALAQGQLDNLHLLKIAKLIMRQSIDHLLGGKELKSRSFAQRVAVMQRK